MTAPAPTLLAMAELGDTDAQLTLAHWYRSQGTGVEDLKQALHWFFIARSLGEDAATEHASEAMTQLDEDARDDTLEQIDDWFVDKIESYACGKLDFADPLMRWLASDRKAGPAGMH